MSGGSMAAAVARLIERIGLPMDFTRAQGLVKEARYCELEGLASVVPVGVAAKKMAADLLWISAALSVAR